MSIIDSMTAQGIELDQWWQVYLAVPEDLSKTPAFDSFLNTGSMPTLKLKSGLRNSTVWMFPTKWGSFSRVS